MVSPWLHRAAVLLAAVTLVFLTFGGSLLGGAGAAFLSRGILYGLLLPVAGGLSALTLVVSVPAEAGGLRRLRALLLAGVAALAALAGLATAMPLPPAVTLVNTCLVYLYFAAAMVLMKATSARWLAGPEYVEDAGTPSMRSLGIALPVLALVQVALGAAYREQALGIMPHIVGAMVIGLVLLTVPLFVLAQYSKHKALRGAAIALLGVTAVQILLGIVAYIGRVVVADPNAPPLWAIVFRLLHVATGAITFASAVVLAVQIVRNVQPKVAASQARLAVSK